MAVFLRENGVLSMGNKTPVTILQETLQKRGLNPHYELIYNGVGTIDPVFKFQVSADGFTAVGDGKSKKEAKHDAAAALLKRMNATKAVTENSEVKSAEEQDIASPYSGALKQNFVGMLEEICVTNKIPLPVFVPVREDGPPHAKIFTIKCCLSSEITETAVARTKKQAKHMAAQQLIKRISDILGDKFIPLVDKPLESEVPEGAQNLKAIENGSFRHDFSIRVSDLHNVFHVRTEECPLPKMFTDLPSKPWNFFKELENPKHYLDELVLSLEGTCKIATLSVCELKEALQEIEKDCYDEEKELEENCEFNSDSGDEDDEKSYVGKNVLEEFHLDESDIDNSVAQSQPLSVNDENVNPVHIEDGNLISNNFEDILKKLDKTDSNEIPFENYFTHLHENTDLLNINSDKKPDIVNLTVECPQGIWSFQGSGKTYGLAVNSAAIEALLFLQMLAIPTKVK